MPPSRQRGMELPCLALFHRDRSTLPPLSRGHSTALFSVSEKKRMAAGDADELLRNKVVCPSTRGLLLVRDPATLATFLWNPQDGDQLHLPPLQGVEDIVLAHSHCLLSDKPSAPGCVVLLVHGGDDTAIWYCHRGDDQWVKHEYDIGTQKLPYPEGDRHEKITICPIAARRGKFYFNCRPTDLGVLEFCPGPVFSSIAIDDSYESEDDDEEEGYEDDEEHGHEPQPSAAVFLVESGDELYMVTLLHDKPCGDEFVEGFVDRMDFSERRWRSVDDLGGRTFLVSLFYFGASCPAGESGLHKDCVYFVNPRKKEMQVFDVKEGTNSLHKLDEAPPADKAFWLFPANP